MFGEQNCPRRASQPAFCYLLPQARQSLRPLLKGARMEYLFTALLVAAVLAAVIVFRPGIYEALFPWLTIIAISSVLLVFALSMGSQLLSPYIDPVKKLYRFVPDMFLVLIVGLGTVSYLYFLRLLTAVRSALNQPASPRSSSTELHYGIGTAIGMSLILGLLVWEWSCNPGERAHDYSYVASELRV